MLDNEDRLRTHFPLKITIECSSKSGECHLGTLGLEQVIKVRYCIYWENMAFIPSSVPKLPLSMEPSRGKMMKSDNPAPDSSKSRISRSNVILGLIMYIVLDHVQMYSQMYAHTWCVSTYSNDHSEPDKV